ncbi:MAG: GNAT family N-acetyltransferase [Bulleidia sp.]
MIEQGQAALDSSVHEIWKKCFTNQNPRWIETYFRYIHRSEFAYCDVEENRAVSVLMRQPHALAFNGRMIQASVLSGAATLPAYRNQGRMHALFQVALDACSHQELITLLPGEENGYYAAFGFAPIYRRSRYTLTRRDVKRITNFGCAYEPDPAAMMEVYSRFVQNFNAFKARNLRYFENLKRETAARNGKIVAYYDGGHICGYAVILLRGAIACIEECIYLDSMALSKLLNAALQERATVQLDVSVSENLGVLFPEAKRTERVSMLARLNDAELFGRLFNARIKTVQEAYALSRKPLFCNERY